MRQYVCTLTLDFEADDEDEARSLFFDYLSEVSKFEVDVQEAESSLLERTKED